MRRSQVTINCVLFAFLVSAATAGEPVAIFNGKSLDGWHGRPHNAKRVLPKLAKEEQKKQLATWLAETKKHWTVEDGELVNDGKGPYLTTNNQYEDFELVLEYKTVAKADSGVYLRGNPQVQIWDYTKAGGKWDRGADKGSGGLFNNKTGVRHPLVLADKPFGKWNHFRILQIGSRTSVWLNGKLVVDHVVMENYWDRARPHDRKGPIQLQTHGGEIRWRHIKLREIDAKEANRYLASRGRNGFKPLFDGKSFAGWQGDIDSYQIVDGAILCKKGAGGNLFTKQTFKDFSVRFEFKLPPGGNNGLAIRFPGKGRPHVDGMCELQVLDSEHEKYRNKLDPRQYHGSAYGITAAHRGYLRPTGEWNFQEVKVVGHRIQVELNGVPILDTDVSKVKEFKDGAAPPGLLRTEGFFGFAGHNDPVAFRNIEAKIEK